MRSLTPEISEIPEIPEIPIPEIPVAHHSSGISRNSNFIPQRQIFRKFRNLWNFHVFEFLEGIPLLLEFGDSGCGLL